MAPPPLRHFASTSALPSRYVTEDTPADLLEGTMDLTVILPAGHNVNMQVHRSTPMMDLLIQVTTAHKINPGGHVIHVVSDNRLLSYKPSTPIGTLDTSVIQIIPKNKVNDGRKNRAHLNTTAIEKNVRLKVNLPRNQLAVYRVPPKTKISDVLDLVCKEKSLDINNYEIRHPVNIDEKLRGVCSLSDYQLQEVTVVPRDYRAPPLSVTDLITMAAISHPEDKKRKGIFSIFSRKTKTSSTGDSSLSSGSAGERSVSPARSDESVDGHPQSNSNRPLSHASSTTTLINVPLPPARPRKRQAPAPPPGSIDSLVNGKSEHYSNNRVEVEKRYSGPLSRNSSSSSDQRSSLVSGVDSELSNYDGSRPTTNLKSVVSTSSLSLASSGKRRAPVPPKPSPPQDENSRPSAIPEETDSVHSLPSQDPKIVEESRVKLNGESTSSLAISQTEPLTSSPSSPSSSSFVSSVSSLSSVEQQASAASSRTTSSSSNPPPVAPQQPAESSNSVVLPPPPPETDAPPPPVIDNEVQSRTASFSSESSEESQGSKRTVNDTINIAPISPKETDTPEMHTNIPETTEPVILKQIPKPEPILNEQDIQTNKSIRERSYSSVSTSSGSSYESTTRKESIIQEIHSNKNVLNGVDSVNKVNLITSINESTNSVKKTNIPKHEDDDCDSGTVSDSSQDQDIVNKQTVKPKREEKIVKEVLKTEILEVPPPVVRIPESDSKLQSSGILADHKLILDKQPSASSGSRKDSVSSMSSVSSYESSNKIEKIKLSAKRSQELSMRDIESQLQEAFSNLDDETKEENVDMQDSPVKKEVPHTIANNSNDSITWEYKIPAPPTGFKDGSADDTSSVSSDSTQEVQIKISSGFNDSLPSLLTEAKNPALIAETNKFVELPTPGESTDFSNYDKKENKDITELNNIVNGGSKQSVINELKHTLKEANNNEPRIVDVKPKVVVTSMAAVSTKKVNHPTESQAPRKDSVNSVSSYESCGDSSDLQKVIGRERRSSSVSSYDSAPPPIPELTYPEDMEVRASRSSSISSTNSAASSNKTRQGGMNFSISTYTTRAEEVSYDKKIVKSESFSHQVRPGKSNLSKAESFTAQYKTDFSSNDLIEEKEDVKDVPFQNNLINKSESFSHQVRPWKSNLSKTESFTPQSKMDFSSSVLTEEKEDVKEVPSFQTNRFITSDAQVRSSSLGRVSSFSEKSNTSKNINDNFVKPELPRHLNRFQHGEISEPLERTASMIDLSHHQTNLRRAQSDLDVTGSGIRDPSMVPMMPDSRLAEEFVKLQQDFFRWQQQLLQNQHLLHSRVAPLASNPPSLQSVGVLRDIMSQSTSNLSEKRQSPSNLSESRQSTSNLSESRQSTSNLSESRGTEKLRSERVVDVKVERQTEENNSDEYQNQGVRSLNRPWLSQSTQDISGSTEESSITASNRKTYTSQPTKRWVEEPNVKVGAWGERPSQAVGVQQVLQDKDHYTSAPRSRSTQDLSTAHIPEGRRWSPPKTFIAPQPFSRSQAENVGFENKPYHRNQQPKIQPQSNNTDQSASEVFWKELQSRRAAFGLQEQEVVEEPTRPPRRTQNHMVNGDATDSRENENSSKNLTYFGQSNGPSEPLSYYYNGEKTVPSALSKVTNNAAISRPRDMESDPSSARYTSVVTLSSDKNSQNQGVPASKDKVRSVVQLSNSDHRPQLRQAPVVRGFRQPVEETQGKQGTFQSRIISNSVNTQPPSQPQQVQHKSPPPLNHGYSAPQLGLNPSQYSHSSTSYQGPASSRVVPGSTGQALRESMTPSGNRSSSPASSTQGNTTAASATASASASASAGVTFPSVKLRPVTNTSPRASPPVEIAAPSSTPTTSPPPPPPAPVAPPPPPPAALAPGERRTASGKIIKPAKKGPSLDPREELMLAIRNASGGNGLRKTRGN